MIELKQLKIGYGNSLIQSSINLDIEKGTLVAIIGENGVGKSTLLKTMIGLQPALSGNIYLDGEDIANINIRHRAFKIAVLFSQYIVSQHFSVEEIITFGRYPYTNWFHKISQEDKQKIKDVCEFMQIEQLTNKKYQTLSDGEKQKVQLAKVIVQETPYIFLDEPSSHLDIKHKILVYKKIKELTSQYNKSILFTTHDLEFAFQICDKVLLIDKTTYLYQTASEIVKSSLFKNIFLENHIYYDELKKTFRICI